MVNYMERRVHKDYIQLEIVVEKEGQKGILLGKVCYSSLIFCQVCQETLYFMIFHVCEVGPIDQSIKVPGRAVCI